MAKMKIFELKNYINGQIPGVVESKDIQEYLEKNMGVKKTHSSNLEDNEVDVVKKHFIPQARPVAAQAPKPVQPAAQRPVGDRPANQSAARPAAPQTGVRPAGAGQMAPSGQRPQTSAGMQGNQRPAGQGMPRPQGDGGMAQRPMGSGQGNMRQGQPGQTNPQGSQGQQMGQRPAGDRNQQGGMRQGQPGQRPQNYQAQPNSLGQRATGQSIHQGQQVQQVQQGTRSMENQGGMRNNQTYQNQQGQQMQQGQRPMGDRNQGYQGQRPMGDRNQQGGMRQGGYQGQQGQRPAGDRNQQGGMRQGGYQGQQGQRPMGDRNQQDGYQGQRPNGQQGYQGQGQGGYQGGQRPYNNQQGGVRAAGVDQGGQQRQGYQGQRPYGDRNQQGGPRTEGQGGYQNRTPRPYNQDGRPQGGNRPAGQGGYSRPDNRTGGQGGYSRPDNRTGGQGGYSRPDNRTGGQGGYSRPDNRTGGQGGYSRPDNRNGGGQRTGGGYNSRGFEDFQKDEDDKPSYGNRSGQGAKKGPGRGNSERKNFDQQILDQKVAEKNDFSNKRNRDRINKEKTYKEKSLIERQEVNEDSMIKNKLAPKKGQFIQPKPLPVVKEDEIKTITLPEVLTIKELADKMKMPSAALVKKLFLAGKMVSINSEITYEEAEEIALEYDIISEKEVKVNEVEELLKETEEDPSTQQKRPPVVCVMGHVDHGKTSLLDAIRETNVTSREAGGITQHIGAYVVEVNGEKITFLDTPGHEAFTAMRMRGAQATDIAILVVAADDGVMPQTVEAISHAKAAGVQIIVAINKIDKPSANIERVKQELTEYELIAEDWGGDTIFVPVSAHTKEGIEQLLEMILLAAEMKEVKANPDRNARGIIIEAELDKGRGPVATILVQKGTLHIGDNVAVGASYGKVRAMMDDKGRRVKEATPSMPVEILGLNEVPDAGEIFIATDNEKEARTIADAFITQGKEKLLADTKAKLSLDGLFSQIQAGNIKELNLIIKADVQGSVEAMKQSLVKLSNDEVAVRILHGGVGAINESDVILASTSNAIIIGFNVKPDNAAKDRADREKVDVKLYRVIYNAIDDIEAAMKGMLDPIFEERIIGHAEVRMTFKASGVGTIAGSYVLDGKIQRGCKARIYRDNELIYEGILSSLKRFQDDVKEVATGYECGLVFEKFNDVKEGDKVELYIMAEVPR